MGALRRLFEAHRKRLARLTAVAGAAVLALVLLPHVPRTVDIELELGPSHQSIVEVRVAYVQSGEELQGVSLAFPGGAPSRVHHSVRLPPGDFEVHTAVRPAQGALRAAVGKFHAPADGPVLIRVEPPAP
jgi:hypothetical protein